MSDPPGMGLSRSGQTVWLDDDSIVLGASYYFPIVPRSR